MQTHPPQDLALDGARRPALALVAHDRKKDAIVALAREFQEVLARCRLCATGTTGGRLVQETGLEVERLLSGPLGGDLQIGARLATGEVDMVVFLRDPMTPQPHEPDINALVRACDVHDIPCATNARSARMLLRQLRAQLDAQGKSPGEGQAAATADRPGQGPGAARAGA